MTVTAVNGASSPTTTYQDGPGNPTQGSMVWAASSFTWWYFQINSANDVTGIPGTHAVSAWYNSYSSCAGDPGAGTWVYYGDSPNLNAFPNSTSAQAAAVKFRNGRSLGAVYWNNSGGTNKDICHVMAGVFMATGVPNDANATVGNLRAILGSTSLTWGAWGYYVTNKFNYADSNLFAAFAMARGTDGRIHAGANILSDQLDAAVIASRDVDTSDSWTVGGGQATGTWSTSSAVITSLSSEAGMAVGYSMTAPVYGGTGFSTQQISSIDSGTQVTLSKATTSAGPFGDNWGWSNFTCGTRTDLIADSGMTDECNAYGLVPLAAGAMLMVYDTGNVAAPGFSQLSSTKGSGTIAAGFWPNGGTGKAVFGGTLSLAKTIAASPTGATESGATATITTTTAHGFLPGQPVNISGVGVSGYNNTATDKVFVIIAVPSSTTFTYAPGASGLAGSGAGTATAYQADNDWCVCGVSTTAIYTVRRTATTTCDVRNYVVASDTWQAITNAPPTMTGKTILAGGGVCLVSDGTDMWLVVIDSTDAQIKYVKYTHGGTNINGTWGSWTSLTSVGATAAFLTCVISNGYLCAAWTEINGNATNYDTKVASLSVGSHSSGPPAAQPYDLEHCPGFQPILCM